MQDILGPFWHFCSKPEWNAASVYLLFLLNKNLIILSAHGTLNTMKHTFCYFGIEMMKSFSIIWNLGGIGWSEMEVKNIRRSLKCQWPHRATAGVWGRAPAGDRGRAPQRLCLWWKTLLKSLQIINTSINAPISLWPRLFMIDSIWIYFDTFWMFYVFYVSFSTHLFKFFKNFQLL